MSCGELRGRATSVDLRSTGLACCILLVSSTWAFQTFTIQLVSGSDATASNCHQPTEAGRPQAAAGLSATRSHLTAKLFVSGAVIGSKQLKDSTCLTQQAAGYSASCSTKALAHRRTRRACHQGLDSCKTRSIWICERHLSLRWQRVRQPSNSIENSKD